MRSVLITGASRGIGLEFVRQLCRRDPAPEFVFASCREPEKATDLQEIAAVHDNVKIIQIDVTNEATYRAAVEQVTGLVGPAGLNVLINNAGVFGGRDREGLAREGLMNTLNVNLIGPMCVTQAFLPLIRQAAASSPVTKYSIERAAIINISSGYGSITENTSGGSTDYRVSKAGLNMYSKNLSLALRPDQVLVFSQCPGWVQTDLGGKNASRTVQDSISDMLTIFSQVSEEHNGGFLRNRIPIQLFSY